MSPRIILAGFIVVSCVTDAAAQNRGRWRPGSILGGLRARMQAARQETNVQEPTLAPVEGASRGIIEDGYRNGSPYPVQAYPTQPPLSPPPRPVPPTRQPQAQAVRAISVDDVIELVRRGLGESTIVQYIGENGVRRQLEVSDLIRLHEEGVTEPIINAMQTARVFAIGSGSEIESPFAGSSRFESQPRFADPPRRSATDQRFGPSILDPPRRPVMHLPVPDDHFPVPDDGRAE
jgi:hypothetical protein